MLPALFCFVFFKKKLCLFNRNLVARRKKKQQHAVDDYIQVDQFKVMYLSGDPEDSRDLPPTYYKRCVDFSSALAVSQAITEIVNITNANLGGKGTLLIFRETLEGATGYSDAAQSAATNGLRVVTIDFNCSKAQAIATLTASQPRDRNAFVFQSYVDGIANIPLLLQTIRDDIGRKCVVSERMTVHTFDGAAYKHTGIGDYVLFRQDPLWGFNGTYQPDSYVDSIEIQVRKTQCSDTSKNQACISAIGIRRGGYDYQYAMTLQYDRELNDNVVTLNGNIVPADSALYSFGLFVRRVEPNIGLHADYYIAAMHTPLISVDFFTEQSRDPLIVINALPYSFATSTGMCGTFDSCLENEFVTADGKIVVGANESAPTWRVSGGASIFEWDQYLVDVDPEASLSLRQPFIPADWKSVARRRQMPAPRCLMQMLCMHFAAISACTIARVLQPSTTTTAQCARTSATSRQKTSLVSQTSASSPSSTTQTCRLFPPATSRMAATSPLLHRRAAYTPSK